METLQRVNISMQDVTNKLAEGVQLFIDAFDKLLSAVEKKRSRSRHRS